MKSANRQSRHTQLAAAKLLFRILLLTALLLTALILDPHGLVHALQLTSPWSPPQRMPGEDNNARPPFLVADQDRTVHALNSQFVSNQLVIYYSRWTVEQGWSPPMDILLSPVAGQARIKGVFLDNKGVIHVAFFGGDESTPSSIYYSRALASEANRAPAWSKPEIVGPRAIIPDAAILSGDEAGNLVIVYSGNYLEGTGLYATISTDGGDTWSEPDAVYLADSFAPWSAGIQIDLDDQGRFHTVWTANNNFGNGEMVYYARLEANHTEWSKPVALATKKLDAYEVDHISIKSYEGTLFAIYNDNIEPGAIVPTWWIRRSTDGGVSWSEPFRPFDRLWGEMGNTTFLVDSQNTLHMILPGRLDNVLGGVWHSVWQGDRWSDLEPVYTADSFQGLEPEFTNGPANLIPVQYPEACISQGNIILVTTRSDPAAVIPMGIWFSHLALNAPELPISPLPTPLPSATPVPTIFVVTPTATPSPTPWSMPAEWGDIAPAAENTSEPTTPLMLAVVPVVLMLSLVVIVNSTRRR